MSAAGLAVKTEKSVMKQSAEKIWEKIAGIIYVLHLGQRMDIFFQRQWQIRDLSVWQILKMSICRWDFLISRLKDGDWEVH